MAVPTDITDLSVTATSNSPSGSESIGTSLDDYMRATQAIVKQNVTKGIDIPSSGTPTIPNAGNYFVVTGTTGITGFGDTWNGRIVTLKFSGALTLTNSSSLILFGENITTEDGDTFVFVNESTGVYRCLSTTKASGAFITADSTDTLTNKTIVAVDNTITTAPSGTLTSIELNDVIAEIATELLGKVDDGVLDAPQNTSMVFYQNSAPTGWTLDDTKNNYMVRTVASASWVGSGGSDSPILMDKVSSHTHNIYYRNVSNGTGAPVSVLGSSGSTDGQVTSLNNAGASNWTPKYIDVVIGVKD